MDDLRGEKLCEGGSTLVGASSQNKINTGTQAGPWGNLKKPSKEYLNGERFNRIAEHSPELTHQMALSLGLKIGELRKVAFEGKLTIDTLIDAIVSISETEYLMQGKNGERLKESINQFDRGEAREYINGELVPIETCDRSKLNGFMSAESEGDTGE